MFLLDNRSNLEKFDHQNDQIESTQNDRCFPLDYLPFSQPLHSTKTSVGPSVKSLILCQAQLESSAKNEKKIVQGENQCPQVVFGATIRVDGYYYLDSS